MSERVKWDELTDKDKVKLILQHVIPHEIADDIVFENLRIVVKRRWTKDNPCKPIEWPVAAWDDLTINENDPPFGYWMTRDIASNWDTAFDPLHDMNDAWKIAESEKFSSAEVTKRWLGLGDTSGITLKYICQIVIRGFRAKAFGKTPQEAICKAALNAVGLEIDE